MHNMNLIENRLSECKLRLDQFLIIMQEKWKQSEVDDHIRSAFLAFDSKCELFDIFLPYWHITLMI